MVQRAGKLLNINERAGVSPKIFSVVGIKRIPDLDVPSTERLSDLENVEASGHCKKQKDKRKDKLYDDNAFKQWNRNMLPEGHPQS